MGDLTRSGPSHHPWGLVAITAGVTASVIGGLVLLQVQDLVGVTGDTSPTEEAGPVATAERTTSSPVPFPTDGRDRVQNLGLGISPPEISIAAGEYTTIEVTDATPDTFIDIEIAQPEDLVGELSGICPEITDGPCHLVYSGGDTANSQGVVEIRFPSPPEPELHPGIYEITVRDRHTAATVSIGLQVTR